METARQLTEGGYAFYMNKMKTDPKNYNSYMNQVMQNIAEKGREYKST